LTYWNPKKTQDSDGADTALESWLATWSRHYGKVYALVPLL